MQQSRTLMRRIAWKCVKWSKKKKRGLIKAQLVINSPTSPLRHRDTNELIEFHIAAHFIHQRNFHALFVWTTPTFRVLLRASEAESCMSVVQVGFDSLWIPLAWILWRKTFLPEVVRVSVRHVGQSVWHLKQAMTHCGQKVNVNRVCCLPRQPRWQAWVSYEQPDRLCKT